MVHKRYFFAFSAAGLLLSAYIAAGLLLSGNLFGQGLTGQISGSVVDPSGSAVAGAKVELTNVGTSQTRTVTSDSAGEFLAPELLAGSYRVRVSVTGFKTFQETGINLTSTERRVLDPIHLELGAISESVSVTAAAMSLQTESSEHSAMVSTAQVMEAPDRGRNSLGLLNMLPGVVDTAANDAPTGAADIRVNGRRY